MGKLASFLLLAAMSCGAQTSGEDQAVIAKVQALFDAMAAHDSVAATALVIPEGRLMVSRANGTVSNSTLGGFAARLATAKSPYIERMWNPKVMVRGGIAVLWTEYDFHTDGKLTHCGIDSFQLVKMPEGWKISGLAYTVEPTGCAPSPLGPRVSPSTK